MHISCKIEILSPGMESEQCNQLCETYIDSKVNVQADLRVLRHYQLNTAYFELNICII